MGNSRDSMTKLPLVFYLMFILIPVLGFQLFTLQDCETVVSGTSKRSKDLHCRCKTLPLCSVFTASLPAVIGESGSYLSNPLGLWGNLSISIKILVVFNPSVLVLLWKVLTVSCPQSFNGKGETTVLWTNVAVVNWPTLAHRSLKYISRAQVC